MNYALSLLGITVFLVLGIVFLPSTAGGLLLAGGLIALALRLAIPKKADVSHGLPPGNKLSQFERNGLKPLRQAREELARVVASHQHVSDVKVVGKEALAQADEILLRALGLVRSQEIAKQALRSRDRSEKEISAIELKLESATTVPEHDSLQRALEAQKQALKQMSQMEGHVQAIDSRLSEASAILLELKSRLVAAALQGSMGESVTDDLAAPLAELKALSQTLAETESSLHIQS